MTSLHIVQNHSPTATDLLAQAREAAGEEVAELLKAADQLQDRLNTVIRTNLAPVGVLGLAKVQLKDLIAFSNNVVSLMERTR